VQDRWGWVRPEILAQISAAARNTGASPLERDLIDGDLDWVQDHSLGTNEVRRVEYVNGRVGYFKPFSGLNQSTATAFGQDAAVQPLHETAAYQLARDLGSPWSRMVPQCVLRQVEGRLGSVIEQATGDPPYQASAPVSYAEVCAAAFFDAVIGQQDRHEGNFFVTQSGRIELVDHGFTFARDGDALNWSEFVRLRQAIRPRLIDPERAALDRMINSSDLLGIADVIGADRAFAMRRRIMVMRSIDAVPQPGVY
jgi:hypothetical protein